VKFSVFTDYPSSFKDDESKCSFIININRLTGLAEEMGACHYITDGTKIKKKKIK